MRKIILTGASGFIGRHAIMPLLNKGYEVHALFYQNRPDFPKNDQLQWHQCDLHNFSEQEQLIQKIKSSHLLHFAWITKHNEFWTSPENFKWVQTTLELLKNFNDHGGKRVVIAGTCAEYDCGDGLCSETSTPLKPSTAYGTCKNRTQEKLRSFSKKTNLSSAWGRIFYIYGPNEGPARFIPSIIQSLLSDKEIKCTHGEQIRDFLYVQDAADAFVSLLDSSVEGAVNIASGQPLALKAMANQIGEILSKPSLIKLGAIPAPEGEPPKIVGNNDILKNQIGWRAQWDIKRGLDQTIEWWKNQLPINKGTC